MDLRLAPLLDCQELNVFHRRMRWRDQVTMILDTGNQLYK